jgi:hypothetical protein
MSLRFPKRLRLVVGGLAVLAVALSLAGAYFARPAHTARAAAAPVKPFCSTHPQFCTETADPWNYAGQYTGHDEPSLLFYSSVPGSGNSDLYHLTLPADPPTAPNDSGTGGTWNFQLHPTFWFGMAMCDDQSAPNVGGSAVAGPQIPCTPDSDTNIFTSTNPNSANYMGKTPGTAFMEMQFYPPGWGNVGTGVSCGPNNTQWCAALNIDSFSSNSNTGVVNNNACLNAAGEEYVNYAIITKSGHSQAPADPLRQTTLTFSTTADTLEMNSGDQLSVDLHDTSAGFQVVITDHTTGQTGSMTASIANGFGHPVYDPSASTCTDQAYAFHPMYSTSSPNTRVLWAAHSYNVAYSDEVGHFEYCNKVDKNGNCTKASVSDPSGPDSDDVGCSTLPLVNAGNKSFTGCLGEDLDFDGPEYAHNWPGSLASPSADQLIHAAPVTFTSPLFTGPGTSGLTNYQQAAFETNLPRIEFLTSPPCQRHAFNPSDPSPGSGCVDPPAGSSFYPFFSTVSVNGACVWQEGDANLPGTINNFGGTPTAEYGPYVVSVYPRVPTTSGSTQGIIETFHTTLNNNPCPA